MTLPDMDYTVSVDLGTRTYPIYIGSNLLASDNLKELLGTVVSSQQAMVISNPTVFELYGDQVVSALGAAQVDVHLMPDGEAHKNMESFTAALDALMQTRHNRSTCVYALGGGVVGDMAGFVAATYQRGVAFVQIPTTLLSQVDSSVGGKTAINHPLGKNMIGAFYQPRGVVIDIDVLSSLPPREYAAGLAEVVKYGVIYDSTFFAWLEEQVAALKQRDAATLAYAIKRSVEIKADVVAQDEREGGLRAILNFGHTFGHAIENLSGYGHYLHGEAVAMGMVMAADFSSRLDMLVPDHVARIETLLRNLDLPTALTEPVDPENMLQAMGMDKKVMDGQLRLILARDIGQVEIVGDYPGDVLRDLLHEYTA